MVIKHITIKRVEVGRSERIAEEIRKLTKEMQITPAIVLTGCEKSWDEEKLRFVVTHNDIHVMALFKPGEEKIEEGVAIILEEAS